MAGYNGFSMSNNAVLAYESGEKPLSKWTKEDIIEAIENAIKEDELSINCSMEKLKKAPVKVLKALCLYQSSWHHTSNYYNKTNFYSLDTNGLENLTDEMLESAITGAKTERKKEPVEEKWECAFLEWSGTRAHPKATEVIEIGTVKGDWFYRSDGSKKKTTANGFRFIKKIDENIIANKEELLNEGVKAISDNQKNIEQSQNNARKKQIHR